LERAIEEEKRKAREEIEEFKANLENDYKNRLISIKIMKK
jgi:hypothetical protein